MNKIYDRDFKVNAVLLSYKKGNKAEVGRELNIDSSLLTRWQQDYEQYGTESFPGTGFLKLNSTEKIVFALEKRIKEADLKFEILKKGNNLLHQGKFEIFRFIQANEKKYSIRIMCKVLNVSTRTYSTWKSQNLSETKQKKILIKKEIIYFFFKFKQRYGAQRIAKILQNRGHKISSTTAGRYMKELGLSSKISK
ncbi:IS3 family transposase [Flavobacterium sp. 17A]|uniref:IS3 family transposase n=1 Tax=Flavobacterium potami TaxID=2872310 RepID=A0A9X1HBX1_9FLAO|nr:IS3 family transposase [Flavobacterium potami]MBZ4035925.1 IS3 family transposase [Flavobacterium potami]